MDLPDALVMHILGLLPASHKAAVVKLLSKTIYSIFKDHKTISIASCVDLPAVCVLDHLKQLQQSNDSLRQQELMYAVAFQGDLPRLQLLRNQGCYWGWSVCGAAAKGGHLDTLQWLLAHVQEIPFDHMIRACEAVASRDHLVLDPRLTTQNPLYLHQLLCTVAARHGHLHILRWLRTQSPPRGHITAVCAAAAEGGHLEVLRWLRAQTPPYGWDVNVCQAAACKGHLSVLQWVRSQDPPCPWDADVSTVAAGAGHLKVLQWLRAQEPPCPGILDISAVAAAYGHLHVLEWALAQDPPAPWTEFACRMATRNGHLHILQWVEAHQPALPWDKEMCLTTARQHGRGAIAEWLESIGVQ